MKSKKELGYRLENKDRKRVARVLREFIIFFAVIFLTCVVGIIELLPELDKIDGVFGWISVSAIYFGLLAGLVFSIHACFKIYKENRKFAGEYGFYFATIEPFLLKGKIIKVLLIAGIILVFITLYLVKTGFLQ